MTQGADIRMVRLAIIIPVYNDAAALRELLLSLQRYRTARWEILVVDGGSTDDSARIAAGLADRVLTAPTGRAAQMNVGAAATRAEILWFVHADTQLPADARERLFDGLQRAAWGRFDVRLSGPAPLLRVVETLMNWRSRWSGIATGDQAIFVTRAAFEQVGGYPPIPLMEDIALSTALGKTVGRPACLATRLVTSSRRWERDGMWRTIGLMWWLRFAYWWGVSPDQLAARYYPNRVFSPPPPVAEPPTAKKNAADRGA